MKKAVVILTALAYFLIISGASDEKSESQKLRENVEKLREKIETLNKND